MQHVASHCSDIYTAAHRSLHDTGGQGHLLHIRIVREGVYWNTRQLVAGERKSTAETSHEVSQSCMELIHSDEYRDQIVGMRICRTVLTDNSLHVQMAPTCIHTYALTYTHKLTTPLADIHIAGGGDTYSKLGLFLKASPGILVSWFAPRSRTLET